MLGRERALQDTLRLLTVWFKYGSNPAVDDAVQRGFGTIPIEMWLLVTPQIIARRGPPALPSQLAATLLDAEQCAFAQADDAEMAISLYTDAFYAGARGVHRLDYSQLGWTGARASSAHAAVRGRTRAHGI